MTKILEIAGYLRVHEILEMLEEGDSMAIQPENTSGSVSDSGVEDGGIANKLPGCMLRAPSFLV